MALQKQILMILMLGFFGFPGPAQDRQNTALVDRQPAVAGQFYSSDPQQLEADLAELFSKAEPRKTGEVFALISPHAGYMFSGEVAASSFNQLDPKKTYDNIFIIASSHRYAFEGASIYDQGNYRTPLGTVKVNIELARKLINDNEVFNNRVDAHLYEHSLEVQLPFLQYRLENEFRIVPVVLGTQSAATCALIAKALQPYFNERNLFVISSDFSHYPDYDDAYMVDKNTAQAILCNDPDKLRETLQGNSDLGIDNLATSLCGWTSVLTLLDMTTSRKDLAYTAIRYMNSGDSPLFGDKKKVVGYYSIIVGKAGEPGPEGSFRLSEQEKKTLLNIARSTISQYLDDKTIPPCGKSMLTERLQDHCGAFVTLHKDGQLRGCIGRFDATEPLYEVVTDMAVSAATRDYRFPPVDKDEVDELEIEISVLSPLRPIHSIDEIILGKHGIYMKKGTSSGTFLPQVASETGWSVEEFLGHCARDKARIGWDGWKEAELFIYEALIFSETDFQ